MQEVTDIIYILYCILHLHFMHLADAFIKSDFQCIQAIYLLSVCVPWELNPQPFALLTQCSTTEPQQHYFNDWSLHFYYFEGRTNGLIFVDLKNF